MMIWMRLVESMIKNTGLGPPGADSQGDTDMPADVISYFFMVWISVILGGVLLIEQYFGSRIDCFRPEQFPESAPVISGYCWQHGDFAKNETTAGADMNDYIVSNQTAWILQSYVYYFLRALIFFLPHILWNTKHRPWISAMVCGTADVIRELEKLWLEYADLADKAYADYDKIHTNNNTAITTTPKTTTPPPPTTTTTKTSAAAVTARKKLDVTYAAVLAMTRDTVQITQQQVPLYSRVLTFVTLRLLYTFFFVCLYVAFDLFFFVTVNRYDSTDYYCPLPNGETIRCVVPMMQFLWHGALLGVCCSVFVLLVTIQHAFQTLGAICSSSTHGCFLERVPLSGIAADLSWESAKDRRTYKILSRFLLHNICILHPLNFLEAFVQHLSMNKQVPQVSQALGVDVSTSAKYKGKYDPVAIEDIVKETEGL